MFIKTKSLFSKQDSFLKNVAVLSSASVIAQIVNVLFMPLFSRLYSPSDFGTLSLFTSIVGLLATVSGFRYYLVIPLARTNRYLHSLIWISLILQSICVVLIILMVEIASKFVVGTPFAVLSPYRFLIPLGVLCVGIYSLLTQWAIRVREFPLIAKTKLTQTFSRSAVILFCGLTGLKPLGLLLGNIFGESFGSTSLFRRLLSGTSKITFSTINIKRASIYYRKMFLYETPSAFINMSGMYFLPIIMAYYFVPDIVGSYSMSQQILALPSALIGTAIGQVFIQKASEAKAIGNVSEVMLKTMIMLVRTGLFPILAIGLMAPSLFTTILGYKWAEAGKITQILSPWVALNFVYSPLSMVFIIMMQQKYAFIYVSSYTVLRILSLYIGRNDPILAMKILSFVGSVSMIIGVLIPAYLVRLNFKKMFYQISIAMTEILIALLPIITSVYFFNNKVPLKISIFACICAGSLYFYFFLKKIK